MKAPIIFVVANTLALKALRRTCGRLKPGAIIPTSKEEMESLRRDTLFIYTEQEEEENGH